MTYTGSNGHHRQAAGLASRRDQVASFVVRRTPGGGPASAKAAARRETWDAVLQAHAVDRPTLPRTAYQRRERHMADRLSDRYRCDLDPGGLLQENDTDAEAGHR